MNTAISAQKTEALFSKPALRWAGLAAVAGCAAACSTPMLLAALSGAALGGGAAATAVAAIQGTGVELAFGAVAAIAVLGVMALQSRRNPAPTQAPELPIACDPTLFTKEERVEHIEQTKALLVKRAMRMQPLENGIEFHYTATDDVFMALAEWTKFEHRCCAWARFTLELEPFAAGTAGGMVLRITGSPEIAPLFVESLKQLDGTGPLIEEFLRGDSVLKVRGRDARGRSCRC